MLQVKVLANAKMRGSNSFNLIECANNVTTLFSSLQMWYLPSLRKQKEKASSLIAFLDNKFPD
jgi:hypothetical protein